MITLSGYTIEEELYHGEKSVIFRGKKGSVPVILKYLNEEYPSLSSLEIFKKEYNLLTRFTLQNSVRTAGLENCGNSVVIVFEDIGAVSLSELLKGKKNWKSMNF